MSEPIHHKIIAVVLYYNGESTLFQVIAGIKNQSLKVDKILVIDNASDIDLTDRFKNDPEVSFIRLPANGGVGAGHNYGWKVAMKDWKADLIWSLEHDTIPKPDCLTKLVPHYNPDVLAAIGPVEDDGLDYANKEYYIFHSQGVKKLSDKKNKDIYKGGMSFNGVLIPVSLVQKVGFLNEEFFVGREDFDFFRRIYKLKGHVLRVPEARVLHNVRRDHKPVAFLNKVILFPNQSIIREYYSYRNSVYMSRQQGASIVKLYIRHTAGILITLLFRNNKGTRIRNRVKAFRNGLLGKLGK